MKLRLVLLTMLLIIPITSLQATNLPLEPDRGDNYRRVVLRRHYPLPHGDVYNNPREEPWCGWITAIYNCYQFWFKGRVR